MRRPLPLLAVLSLTVGLCVSGCSASTSSGGQEPIREAAADTAAPVSGPSAAPAGASTASAAVSAAAEPSGSPEPSGRPVSSGDAAQGAAARPTYVTSVAATARDRAIDVSWEPAPDLRGQPGWQVTYKPVDDSQEAMTVPTRKTSMRLPDLLNGVTYRILLYCVSPTICPFPDPVTAEATPRPSPDAPAELTARASQPGQITLSWRGPAGGTTPTSYVVEYVMNEHRAHGGIHFTTETKDATTSYTVKDLNRGDVITFAVASHNQYGTSGWTSTVTATAS